MAVVLKGVDGVPYLDKFAVTPEAQGAGLGAAVWQALIHRCPEFYWRSRDAQPGHSLVFRPGRCQFYRGPVGGCFSVGINDFDQLKRCKEDCLSRAGKLGGAGQVNKIVVIGARGYTGAELLPILHEHPDFELVAVSFRQRSRAAGERPCQGYGRAAISYSRIFPSCTYWQLQGGCLCAGPAQWGRYVRRCAGPAAGRKRLSST